MSSYSLSLFDQEQWLLLLRKQEKERPKVCQITANNLLQTTDLHISTIMSAYSSLAIAHWKTDDYALALSYAYTVMELLTGGCFLDSELGIELSAEMNEVISRCASAVSQFRSIPAETSGSARSQSILDCDDALVARTEASNRALSQNLASAPTIHHDGVSAAVNTMITNSITQPHVCIELYQIIEPTLGRAQMPGTDVALNLSVELAAMRAYATLGQYDECQSALLAAKSWAIELEAVNGADGSMAFVHRLINRVANQMDSSALRVANESSVLSNELDKLSFAAINAVPSGYSATSGHSCSTVPSTSSSADSLES